MLKRERYERAGTPAYWIVDPDGPSLLACELRDGRYDEVAHVGPGATWTATIPFTVSLTPGVWAD